MYVPVCCCVSVWCVCVCICVDNNNNNNKTKEILYTTIYTSAVTSRDLIKFPKRIYKYRVAKILRSEIETGNFVHKNFRLLCGPKQIQFHKIGFLAI